MAPQKGPQDASGKVDPKAVFVRGLPEGATDNDLRAFLEGAGPIVTCYRIRGDYGIAQFKEAADASKCIEHLQGKEFKGSPLNLSVAKPKRPAKGGSATEPPAKRRHSVPDEQAGGSSSSRPSKGEDKGEGQEEGSEKKGPDLRSVILAGMPKNLKKEKVQAWIEEKMPGGCGIESVRGATDQKGAGGGSFVVSFRKGANAMRALEVLNDGDFEGSRVSATLRALEMNRQSEKAGRLIVRNLAFGATAKHLRKTFEPLGAIADVHLPMNSSGKNHRGFGFVQYEDVASAQKAIADLNGTKICGRGVAVDFAVGSGLYSALQKEDEKEKTAPAAKTPKRKASKPSGEDGEKKEDEEDDEEDEEEKGDEAKEQEAQLNTKGDSEKERAEEIRKMKKLLEESDKEDEEEDDKEEGKEKKPKRKTGFDVDQGRTVFVRNVPFDGTEADMLQVFKKFGVVKSVKLLADKSGKNKHCGTAFVQFRETEGAEAALAAENEAERKLKELSSVIKKSDRRDTPAVEGFGIALKGRRLILRPAVTPESAVEIQAAKKPEKGAAMAERKTWMHLLQAGEIRQDSDAWERLSKSEQNQRRASMKERKWRINNSNFAIHPLRLSVRNIPRKIGGAELRTELLHLLMQHKELGAKSSNKRDTMAKAQEILETVSVMRDDDRRNVETNERRSRGYGFVQVKDHKFAMAILEHLNDNPKVFGSSKRPIVEFAIEDKRKLRMQQELYEKNAHKLLGEETGKGKGNGKGKGKDKGDADGKGKGKGEKGEKGESASKKIENRIKRKHVIKTAKKEGKELMSRGKRQREKKRAKKALEAEKLANQEAYNTKRDKVRGEQKAEKQAERNLKPKVKRQLMPDAGASAKKKKLKTGEMTDDFELRAMERFRQGKR